MSARERLYATSLDDVRPDHLARYRWVAERLAGLRVIDAACGCGYGSAVLADAGCLVIGLDNSAEAIVFAQDNWKRPGARFAVADLMQVGLPAAEAVVSFETIEHLKRPKRFLRAALRAASILICSVPNERVVPFGEFSNRFHYRHYTQEQLESRLWKCGWAVSEWFGQADKQAPVTPGAEGRTIIAVAGRRRK